jgi:hypothetical protein
MQVQFTDDELNEALIVLVARMVEEASLSDKDKALLKRWRTGAMRLGSDDMNDFVHKANEDLKKGFERRQRSPIRKPDWAD